MDIKEGDIIFADQCQSVFARHRMVKSVSESEGFVYMYAGTRLSLRKVREGTVYTVVRPSSGARHTVATNMLGRYKRELRNPFETPGTLQAIRDVVLKLEQELRDEHDKIKPKPKPVAKTELADVLDAWDPMIDQPTETTQQEEVIMKKIVENKTFVFGVDVAGMTLERAQELVDRINAERSKLGAFTVSSQQVADRCKELDAAEKVVVNALDDAYMASRGIDPGAKIGKAERETPRAEPETVRGE